ncbi:MAG: hypothetical protein AAYR31_00410 [Candidatus Vidania fulgoroideorum]
MKKYKTIFEDLTTKKKFKMFINIKINKNKIYKGEKYQYKKLEITSDSCNIFKRKKKLNTNSKINKFINKFKRTERDLNP